MAGVNHQIVVDIKNLFKPHLFNLMVAELAGERQTKRRPKKLLGKNWKSDLLTYYGIDYRAPMDASKTDIPDASIDFFVSTNTLEHIPSITIHGILKEIKRIAKPNCLISFEIGYWDHYRIADSSISGFNYMQFTDSEWDKYNPSLHYQNRLRHLDFIEIFNNYFHIIEIDSNVDTGAKLHLSKINLDGKFKSIPFSMIEIESANFVMKPS